MARARKLQALLLTISVMVGIVASAIPAHAAPVGTANLTTSRSVRAGAADQLFTFNVANTGSTSILSPGTGINHVVVIPPGGFSTDLGSTNLAGWTSTRTSNGQIVFDAPANGSLAPGQNANFTVQADAATPPFDLSRAWRVMASDDRGQTLKQLNVAVNGSLTTAIRTLEVLSVTVVGDPRIADMSVTEQQGGIQVQSRITNMANAAQNVTATLSAPNITIEQADGAKSIAAGATQIFNFVIKVGNKSQYTGGRVTLIGDGTSAEGSDALELASGAITVMSRVVGAFQSGTLAPREVAANRPYEFALSIEKDGDAALSQFAGSTFSFANGAFSTAIASPTSIAAGDNQSVRLTFASKNLGALADGNYSDARFTLVGTDENGAAVNQVINVGDTINVDSLIPVVTATLTPPASETSAPPAASNGQTQNLRAVVTDGASATPCSTCTITQAFLQQYQGGTKIATIPVTLSPATSSNPLQPAPAGTFVGTYSGNYDANATSVELFVRAADPAGNDSTDVSDLFAVDNVAPFLTAARTGANGAKNQILVNLSEEVTSDTGSSAASDWNVPGHTVQSAALQPGNASVLLTVSPNVGDNATPAVQYVAEDGLGFSRFYDRVALDMINQAINAIDGIVPAAPLLTGVTGGESDGTRFHTNDSTPELTFGDGSNPVGAGHRLEVYEDLDNDGALDIGEPRVGEATSEGNSVAVTLNSLGTSERDVNLIARALDANNNSSELADSTLKLDFTEPRVQAVARLLDDVTVTFTEGLRASGRNFATDWTLHDRSVADSNFWQQFKPDTIDGTGAVRTLHVDPADTGWDAASLTHLQFEFLGAANERYADLAGNELVNFLRAV